MGRGARVCVRDGLAHRGLQTRSGDRDDRCRRSHRFDLEGVIGVHLFGQWYTAQLTSSCMRKARSNYVSRLDRMPSPDMQVARVRSGCAAVAIRTRRVHPRVILILDESNEITNK